eukprot:jgi/Ulvmu1/7400/UM036_0060.1
MAIKAIAGQPQLNAALLLLAGSAAGLKALVSRGHRQQDLKEVMLTLWPAALRGDAGTVRRLLRQHAIPPDTPHPITGLVLMLETAARPVSTEAEDRQLKDVMEALYLTGREENALHTLCAQQPQIHIMKRVKFLVDTQAAKPTAFNMLTAVNADGQLPEQVAAAHRPEIAVYLYTKKLNIAKASVSGGLMLATDASGLP